MLSTILFGELSELVFYSESNPNQVSRDSSKKDPTLGVWLIEKLLVDLGESYSNVKALPQKALEAGRNRSRAKVKSVQCQIIRSVSDRGNERLCADATLASYNDVDIIQDPSLIFYDAESEAPMTIAVFLPNRLCSPKEKRARTKKVVASIENYFSKMEKFKYTHKLVIYADIECAKYIIDKLFLAKKPNLRYFVICDLNDLRNRESVKVSKGLSWEKTYFEFERQFCDHENLDKAPSPDFELPKVEALFLRCGLDGVLLKQSNAKRPALIFDNGAAEGDFELHYGGKFVDDDEVFFSQALMGISAAESAMIEKGNSSASYSGREYRKIAKNSLISARRHRAYGYKNSNGTALGVDRLNVFNANYFVESAISEVQLVLDKDMLTQLTGIDGNKSDEDREQFREKYLKLLNKSRDGEFMHAPEMEDMSMNVARQILGFSNSANDGSHGIVPKTSQEWAFDGGICSAKFGKFYTVDRKEIEKFRTANRMIENFLKDENVERPLSLAVFGPPGSGKSFGVKQICADLCKRYPNKVAEEAIDVNLSQLNDASQLTAAFHSIRNKVIEGRVPVVFFDEFDCTNSKEDLFWLKYFLAPMQDGVFRDGEVNHKIGKSIFVFAGGTKENFEAFESGRIYPDDVEVNGEPGEGIDDVQDLTNKKAKLPDFSSRIHGYINISGPNPLRVNKEFRPELDQMYVVRRASLLKSFLEINGYAMTIDEGRPLLTESVCEAFLTVFEYRHGARSMQAIVEKSDISNGGLYSLSCLPASAVFKIHINDNGKDNFRQHF